MANLLLMSKESPQQRDEIRIINTRNILFVVFKRRSFVLCVEKSLTKRETWTFLNFITSF